MKPSFSGFEDRIATATSGASSFFGPLVVVAVAVDEQCARALSALALRKHRWWSHELVRKRAKDVSRIVPFELIRLSPRRYNEIIAKGQDRNGIELWACKKAVEAMIERYPDKSLLVSTVLNLDKAVRQGSFGGARHVRQVAQWGTKGDVAVATASVLARGTYLDDLEKLSDKVKLPLPTNIGTILATAKEVYRRHGWEGLREVGKVSFRLTASVTNIVQDG